MRTPSRGTPCEVSDIDGGNARGLDPVQGINMIGRFNIFPDRPLKIPCSDRYKVQAVLLNSA